MIIVSNITSFLLLTYIANSFLIKKYSKEKSLIYFFLAIITISVFNYNGGSPIKAIFVLIIYFLYIFLLFKGDIIKKLFVIIPFFFNTNNYRIISRIYFRTYSHHRINKKCTFVWICIWNRYFDYNIYFIYFCLRLFIKQY